MEAKSQLAMIRWADHYPILATLLAMFIVSHAVIAYQFWWHTQHIEAHLHVLEVRLVRLEKGTTYQGQSRQHP